MAVQQRDLTHLSDPPPRPALHLAAPPPPEKRRVAAALILFALLVGVLAYTELRATGDASPVPPGSSYRPPTSAATASLDAIAPLPAALPPQSSDPAAGMLFVRCTRLWQARPDGSGGRKLLTLPGISSPVYSPDARTIAFLVQAPDRQDLWTVAADGSHPTRIGTVVDFADTNARATSLAWSPDGRELALALVGPGEEVSASASFIWTLDLDTGRFERIASGRPAPFYIRGRLGFAGLDDDNPRKFGTEGGPSLASKLSGGATDLAATWVPGSIFYGYERKTAVLTEGPEGIQLLLRSHYWGNGRPVEPPLTHRYPENARPVLSSDARTLIVELVDFTGQRDVGVYDLRTSQWKVLDYAWEPATSPTPVLSGPLDAKFARTIVERMLNWWDWSPRRASAIAGGKLNHQVIPMQRPSYSLHEPRRAGQSWKVPGFVYGRLDGALLFREVEFGVGSHEGRLTVVPRPASRSTEITTIADAAAALDRMVDAEVVVPTAPPYGARLSRYALSAWGNQGTIYLRLPRGGGNGIGRGGGRVLELSYGDVGFYGGCGGGSGDPHAVTVGDQPALFDKSGRIRQVIWPAAPGDKKNAIFSVYGDVPKDEILEIAESIEARR